MAVDIKQLRIGAHVEVNGMRKRIDHFGTNGEMGDIWYCDPKWSDEKKAEERHKHCWFFSECNPIPITPELLMELGFEKDGDTFTKREKTESDNILSRTYIGVTMIGGMHFRVEACDAVTVCGNMIVSYLHELEAFIYSTLGKELIDNDNR